MAQGQSVHNTLVNIHVDSLLDGARRSRGTTVVIDVFRAFTTAAVALSRGARRIVLTAEPEEALALRSQGVGELCMGEVGGMRPSGFDFGNSPHELSMADVAGKTLIQSTRAGTVGVCAVPAGLPVYATSFVTARATVREILRDQPNEVTLVAMGLRGVTRTDEDELCALYLRNLLQGRSPDPAAVATLVRASGEAGKYGDPAQPHFYAGDLELAVAVDAFDFAVPVTHEGGLLVAQMKRT
jgi:2-phosphosulfolactate phosphatase